MRGQTTGSKTKWIPAAALVVAVFLLAGLQIRHGALAAQTRKTVTITHLFTGSDGQTHAEEIDVPFAANNVFKMLPVAGAELHRYSPGNVLDWHPAPRRQYVITLSGEGEIELVTGQKIRSGPGHIELAEDTTGKGHITRVIGNEDRVTLQIPLASNIAR